MSDFLSMTDIAKELTRKLGRLITRNTIGNWLKEIGLREPDGSPSLSALNCGFAQRRRIEWNGDSYWRWHREKTLAALREGGFIPMDNASEIHLG